MAIQVTKGQLSDDTISKNACHEEYYLCGKFHGFMKSAQLCQFWGYTAILNNICGNMQTLWLKTGYIGDTLKKFMHIAMPFENCNYDIKSSLIHIIVQIRLYRLLYLHLPFRSTPEPAVLYVLCYIYAAYIYHVCYIPYHG